MMVTFVSQCEKKALNRTRRVLDAFANRIGDNTWQTVITEEGLQAVRKLLRKTASKNTAVSCHWIRSRSRSDLLWVVGRRNAFSTEGYVPVNFTSKDFVMDLLSQETVGILANTKNQPLSQHLFAVGYCAYKIIQKMHVNKPRLAEAAFVAGILHDIGKAEPQFQSWLTKKLKVTDDDAELPDDGFHIDKTVKGSTKFSFEKHPRHHEISWLFAQSLLRDCSSLNVEQKGQIAHGIYWHHTKPYRKNDAFFAKAAGLHKVLTKSLLDSNIDELNRTICSVLKDVAKLALKFEEVNILIPSFNNKYSLTNESLPSYKYYDEINDEINEYIRDVNKNALNNLLRAAVISADRLVSSFSSEDLSEYLSEGTLDEALDVLDVEESDLANEISQCLNGFETKYPNGERNKRQAEAASKLADLNGIAQLDEIGIVGVLQGPAGCGKTKIALEWGLKTGANKIIWICPRVQVCLGLLSDLTEKEYLPNSKIEIFTGEYKKILQNGLSFDETLETEPEDYFSGDIVITTIDQVINSVITHQKIESLVQFMQAHIVFDEFHELVNMPAFNLLFSELIAAKKMQEGLSNTLLVSATPNYFFVEEFLCIDAKDIVSIKSFNTSLYELEFKAFDEEAVASPLITELFTDDVKTFVITNTANQAQVGFLKNHVKENSVLLHSKYTKHDKSLWFGKVFESFKQHGTSEFSVLRSGPIVQASLNISCDKMLTEVTSAENWLQRLGRLDRFGLNEDLNRYITVIPQSILNSKQTSSTARFLNQLFTWESTKAWLAYLQDFLVEKQSFTLNEIYQIYTDFYKKPVALLAIEQDFKLALKKSTNLINEKIMDPISIYSKTKKVEGTIKISVNSLRGDNRFVQMAVCEVDKNLSISYLNDYIVESSATSLTESIERMRGYGDSEKDLVAFMKAKHHNIKENFKKAYNDYQLITEAKSPETPIYLSYTPNDLEPVGAQAHPYSVYYVVCDKQPVGSMSINNLKINLALAN